MKRMLIVTLLMTFSSIGVYAQSYQSKSVRVIYLVSKDREVDPEYKKGIEMAVRDIQGWYEKQMGGRTFRTNEPLLEVMKSNQSANWFRKNPIEGTHKDNWNFENALSEVTRILGVDFLNTEEYTWIIYSDGPGNTGRGGGGICIMPEDDLLGLIGKHPTQPDIKRWIAGLGHELGHAFGLPHPSDTEKDADAIMWTGIYGKYPDQTYLTEQDKEILDKSPFFNPIEEIISKKEYIYNGGAFTRIEGTYGIRWIESKSDSNATFGFEEDQSDAENYYLKDSGRGMMIKVPKAGGQTYWSTDEGQNWNGLYYVQIN